MHTGRRTLTHLITVVIASRCDDARSELLRRACDSVRAMAGQLDYSILVVANGPRVSPGVLEWLEVRPDVRVVQLRSGSHALARRVGVELAEGEFLAFLDDDDEFMPDTLGTKVDYLRAHPEVDVLVTDGLRISESSVTKIFPPPDERCADLVETMMHVGWSACSLTLRARKIEPAVFDPLLGHMEWTLTAMLLARSHQVGYVDQPTFRYYDTTPDSLSKRVEHQFAAPVVWRRLCATYAGTRYETSVRRRHGAICHVASWECAGFDRWREAWRLHRESLGSPGGFAYLPFTLKLLLAPLWRGDAAHQRADTRVEIDARSTR